MLQSELLYIAQYFWLDNLVVVWFGVVRLAVDENVYRVVFRPLFRRFQRILYEPVVDFPLSRIQNGFLLCNDRLIEASLSSGHWLQHC